MGRPMKIFGQPKSIGFPFNKAGSKNPYIWRGVGWGTSQKSRCCGGFKTIPNAFEDSELEDYDHEAAGERIASMLEGLKSGSPPGTV